MRKPTKKHAVLAAAVIIAIILLFVLRGGDTPADDIPETIRSVEMIDLEAYGSSAGSRIIVSGRIRAAQEAALISEISGTVSSVNVSIGNNVSRGQVVATLSNPDVLAQLSQAQAAFSSAQSSVTSSQTGYLNSRLAAGDAIENAYARA